MQTGHSLAADAANSGIVDHFRLRPLLPVLLLLAVALIVLAGAPILIGALA